MIAMHENKSPRILVFDSGVGGLSVLREIHRQHPYCSLSYACDNAAFPYGKKSAGELIDRVNRVLHRLQSATAADIIVIACNSASTLALPRIRNRFKQPIVGVVPAIKPAAKLSKTKVIGLLATPGTIKRHYTKNLINKFAMHCQISSVGSSELVNLAEAKFRDIEFRNTEVCNDLLRQIVQPFSENSQLDTLILACTHFPLLLPELRAALPRIQYWIDSAEAIARRVGYWLEQQNLTKIKYTVKTRPKHNCYFTANNIDLDALRPRLSEWQLDDIHVINI
jgi:glutamate racemase